MAQIASFQTGAASGEKHKVRIDRNCSRLLIKRVSSLSATDGVVDGAPERLLSSIRTHSNQVEELVRLSPKLSHISAYSALIYQEPIFEINAGLNADFFSGKGIDTTGVSQPNAYITYFYVNLTAKDSQGEIAAVGVTSDDDFSLQIEGCVGYATYTVFGIEDPQIGDTMLEYTSINNLSGQRLRKIDVDHLDALVLPAITSIQNVKLQYPMGEPINYSIEELKLINAQAQEDEVYQYTSADKPPVTVNPLVSQLLVLMTHNVVSVELTTDGTEFEFTQVRNRARGAQ